MSWNDERIDDLKVMWRDGLKASQIAGRLGGVTRNAVIGKIHRLGLAGRATSAKPPKKFREASAYRKAAQPRPAPKTVKSLIKQFREDPEVLAMLARPAVDDVPKVMHTADLEPHHCRWIPGDPGTGYCGEHKAEGLSYCKRHAVRAHAPPTVARPYADGMMIARARADRINIDAVSELLTAA